MKLSQFSQVHQLVLEREALEAQRRGAVVDPITVCVSISRHWQGNTDGRPLFDNGTYRHGDEPMSAAVRPAVLAELDRRLQTNADQLLPYGVEID